MAIRIFSPSGIIMLFPFEFVSVTSSTSDTRLSPSWTFGASAGRPGFHETTSRRTSEALAARPLGTVTFTPLDTVALSEAVSRARA
eukprot:705067-Amorphochlora_amoeboformis.AAC.1